MANERKEYARVNGQVLYAGLDASIMKKIYKGEVVYNEEGKKICLYYYVHWMTFECHTLDDRHIPTLTVAQTLQFALST